MHQQQSRMPDYRSTGQGQGQSNPRGSVWLHSVSPPRYQFFFPCTNNIRIKAHNDSKTSNFSMR